MVDNEKNEGISHLDIYARQAVLEAEMRFARADFVEFKADSKVYRQEMSNKVDTVMSALENLKGQRTVVAGIVSATVATAVAVGAALLKKL